MAVAHVLSSTTRNRQKSLERSFHYSKMTERQCLRNELRESLYRPLWGAKKQSPASLDGVVRCFPSETPVGPLTRPTGLSRAQQLVVFDTLKIICLPSFCQSHGGVVRSTVHRKCRKGDDRLDVDD